MKVSGKKIALSAQHTLAMFGATILIPMLMGLPPSLGLFSAGIGTLIYHLVTGGSIPVFLGSSAVYLAAFGTISSTYGVGTAVGSYIGSAISFILMALVIKFIGHQKITKLIPNHVAGAIIIVLGISLVPVSFSLMKDNYGLALISALAMVVFSIIPIKVIKSYPIIFAILFGYAISIITGNVDFNIISEAKWFALPEFIKPEFNIGAIQIMFVTAFVAMLEHLGDLSTNGNIVGKNHFENPGLHKSFLGNGCALLASTLFGGTPVTTYGENTAVLAITKNYDTSVIRYAAVVAILLSLFGKFGALLTTIPLPVIGGVSFMLFGMLMMSGMSTIQKCDINLMDFKNSMVIFIPIFIGIAGVLSDNPIKIAISEGITLSGLSLAALVAIILNLIKLLVDKIETKKEKEA